MSSYRVLLPNGGSTSTAADVPHQQRRTRHRHTEDEWTSKKDTILQLWQKHDAKTVLSLLQSHHGFETGQRTLMNKLRAWGAIRKHLKHEYMLFVMLKCEQRLEREGKPTEFFFHGQLLAQERLERFNKRGKNADTALSILPKTPPGIIYRTPESFQPSTPVGASLSLGLASPPGTQSNLNVSSPTGGELNFNFSSPAGGEFNLNVSSPAGGGLNLNLSSPAGAEFNFNFISPAGVGFNLDIYSPTGAELILNLSSIAAAESNLDLTSVRELDLPPGPITTRVGYNRIHNPEPEHPTHKHRVGKVGVQFAKLQLGPSLQEYLIQQATRTGVEMRDVLSQPILPTEWEAPAMPMLGTHTVNWCVTSDWHAGIMSVGAESSIIFPLQYGELFRHIASFFLSRPDQWTPNWTALSHEDGTLLKAHINRIADGDEARSHDSRYIDFYIHSASTENTESFVAKISLCVGSLGSLVCHTCETDSLTVQFFGASGAIAINVPLPTSFHTLNNKPINEFDTILSIGTWRDVTRRILGHQNLEPCRKKETLLEDDVCEIGDGFIHDPGVWDPLAVLDRQETFQAFPLERHACSNLQLKPFSPHEVRGTEIFDMYPDHKETFQPL